MSLELLVKLPEDLKAFYEESGYQSSTPIEHRTNARLRIRRDAELEFIHIPNALRAVTMLHSDPKVRVLIKDLSRTGIGILIHEQIFPTEEFQVTFQGRLIHATAVRCRRIAAECYEVGARVNQVAQAEQSAETNDDD
ncbi:MAG: hypothetical protein R3C53_12145 [Pirellulaceae bacterium]